MVAPQIAAKPLDGQRNGERKGLDLNHRRGRSEDDSVGRLDDRERLPSRLEIKGLKAGEEPVKVHRRTLQAGHRELRVGGVGQHQHGDVAPAADPLAEEGLQRIAEHVVEVGPEAANAVVDPEGTVGRGRVGLATSLVRPLCRDEAVEVEANCHSAPAGRHAVGSKGERRRHRLPAKGARCARTIRRIWRSVNLGRFAAAEHKGGECKHRNRPHASNSGRPRDTMPLSSPQSGSSRPAARSMVRVTSAAFVPPAAR